MRSCTVRKGTSHASLLHIEQTDGVVMQIAKTSKIEKFRSAAKGLIAAIRVNGEYVAKQRLKLECGPMDTATLADFMTSSNEKEKVAIHPCHANATRPLDYHSVTGWA